MCKKNDLDRVLPSVDVVLLLTLHGPRYWVFHRFHMCIPLFYRLLFIVQICLIMWLSKHFHFIWSAKTLYMHIYNLICYCGVQLPVCTLAYVKQNICFKTVNLNDSSTGWIFSFKLQHSLLHKISTIKNCLSLLSELDVIRVIFCLYTTSLFMILSPY